MAPDFLASIALIIVDFSPQPERMQEAARAIADALIGAGFTEARMIGAVGETADMVLEILNEAEANDGR